MPARSGTVSIDTDFFIRPEEQLLVEPLVRWLGRRVDEGMTVVVREHHVDFLATSNPVDVTINFDFHMDMRVEFLLGERYAAPIDATVFESVLATGKSERYVWAHPLSRRATAARVYAAATLAARQPLLSRIHCVPGPDALSMLDELDVSWAFVCRSPAYATNATDLAFARLQRAIGY
jgi:hypothetical protein